MYTAAPFSEREWSTTAAGSSPSDTTFLTLLKCLSSQDAFKIRLLTQTRSESLGSFARCERQDPGAPLHPHPTSGWNTDGLWITLQWAGFKGRKIRLHRCVSANLLTETIERSGPPGLPWPGLVYILHTAVAFHELWMLLTSICGASVHPLRREKEGGGVGNAHELKAQGDI